MNANINYNLLRQQQQQVGKLQWLKNSDINDSCNNKMKANTSSALPTILLIAHSFELLR